MARKQSLKHQQAKWYKILKDQGFDDIERPNQELKVNTLDRIGRNTFSRVDYNSNQLSQERITARTVHDAKQDYYYYATHFLNSYSFETELEKAIWNYHVEGISNRNIFKTLAKVNIIIAKTDVEKVIKKLKTEMKKRLGIK